MKQWSEQKIYVYISLIFGILFIFLTPPFQSPDEDSHFKKSYQVSKGNLYSTEKNGKLGNYFPKEMLNYIDNKLTYIGNRDKKYSFTEMVNDQYSKMNYDEVKFNNYSTNSIIPVVYTAPAIGILFSKICAKIFGLEMVSTSYMLYFARLFTLFVSIIITAFAIKITPIMKKTFVVVSLIPMTVYLSSMVTYDNVLSSLVLLALAIILDITYKSKSMSKKQIITLSIIGTILLNVKTIYFFIFLLMLAIPYKKFNGKDKKIKTAIIIIGLILGFTFLLKLPQFFINTTSASNSLVNKQLNFVLKHPFKYLEILLINIKNQRFFQLSSMIGLFGLIDTYCPMPIIFMAYINLILIALSEGSTEKIKVSKWLKILSIIYVVIDIIAIFSALYITWTPMIIGKVGTNDITGVQGRYFIPLIMPLLLVFSNNKIKDNKLFKMIKENYVLVPVILLTISVSTILLRFWV